jgi:hypothetical protein
VLTSRILVEELLSLAFQNCDNAYIIIDGIDECPREERKAISQWFRKLVEDLPVSNPDRLRCLFVTQYDGHASRDFGGIASINIQPEDGKHDVGEFSRVESSKVQEKFGLSDERMTGIVSTVTNSVEGTSSGKISSRFSLIMLGKFRYVLTRKIDLGQSVRPDVDRRFGERT